MSVSVVLLLPGGEGGELAVVFALSSLSLRDVGENQAYIRLWEAFSPANTPNHTHPTKLEYASGGIDRTYKHNSALRVPYSYLTARRDILCYRARDGRKVDNQIHPQTQRPGIAHCDKPHPSTRSLRWKQLGKQPVVWYSWGSARIYGTVIYG